MPRSIGSASRAASATARRTEWRAGRSSGWTRPESAERSACSTSSPIRIPSQRRGRSFGSTAAQSEEAPRSAPELPGELGRQSPGVRGAARNDEDGVVAGERTDDERMVDAVEGTGDRRRRAELRLQDDEVLRDGDAVPELTQDRVQQLPRVDRGPALRQDVARAAERI